MNIKRLFCDLRTQALVPKLNILDTIVFAIAIVSKERGEIHLVAFIILAILWSIISGNLQAKYVKQD